MKMKENFYMEFAKVEEKLKMEKMSKKSKTIFLNDDIDDVNNYHQSDDH